PRWLFLMRSLFTPPAASGSSTLSLHDALPISVGVAVVVGGVADMVVAAVGQCDVANPTIVKVAKVAELTLDRRSVLHAHGQRHQDRKSTRLNSSHVKISYAVFCLKKKKK